MMTVPLALTGALLFMWYFDITMNIFSQIGIIMLIGLVSKNGILIVEFANQRKQTGMSKLDAIKFAAASRFRPILMTSLATILGIAPLALGFGEGAQSRVAMGTAVIGGLYFNIPDTVCCSCNLFLSSQAKQKNLKMKISFLLLSLLSIFLSRYSEAQVVYNLNDCIRIGLERTSPYWLQEIMREYPIITTP